jgi:hypothetical protein
VVVGIPRVPLSLVVTTARCPMTCPARCTCGAMECFFLTRIGSLRLIATVGIPFPLCCFVLTLRPANQPLSQEMLSHLHPEPQGFEEYIHSMPITHALDPRSGPYDRVGLRGSVAVEALFGHVRGRPSPHACNNCEVGRGRFRTCVRVVDFGGVYFWRGACTNCVTPGRGSSCSFCKLGSCSPCLSANSIDDHDFPAPRIRAPPPSSSSGPASPKVRPPLVTSPEMSRASSVASSPPPGSPRARAGPPSPPAPLYSLYLGDGSKITVAGHCGIGIRARDYTDASNLREAVYEAVSAVEMLDSLYQQKTGQSIIALRDVDTEGDLGSPPRMSISPSVPPPSHRGSPTLAQSVAIRAHSRNVSSASGGMAGVEADSLAAVLHGTSISPSSSRRSSASEWQGFSPGASPPPQAGKSVASPRLPRFQSIMEQTPASPVASPPSGQASRGSPASHRSSSMEVLDSPPPGYSHSSPAPRRYGRGPSSSPSTITGRDKGKGRET